MNHSSSIDMS